MKHFLIFLFVLACAGVSGASELQDYCDADESGELFSGITDSSTEQVLKDIGLDVKKYAHLVELENLKMDLNMPHAESFEEFAEKYKDIHPEILLGLQTLKLKICLTEGYEKLQFEKKSK